MFSSERNSIRNIFFNCWQKHQTKTPLNSLEAEVLDVILLHPEYQHIFDHPEKYLDKDFADANPFLHMGLHLALREQINTNRPSGIKDIYAVLLQELCNSHHVEHQMMERLAEIINGAQSSTSIPSEEEYLNSLKRL